MNSKRILLVDDEPNIRILLGAVLERSGYTVDVAEDGFAALRAIQQQKPDILITDLRMPNMNGFELLSVIRQRFPELPAIAISGEFLACQISEGPLADAFFQKGSYSLPEFLQKIGDLLDKPYELRRQSGRSTVWRPAGEGPLVLTCIDCLRSYPLDFMEDGSACPKETDCIFCGARLQVQLAAVGLSLASTAK